MAQLVEQLIRNQQVAGSSPASSSQEDIGTISGVFFCFIGNLRRIFYKAKKRPAWIALRRNILCCRLLFSFTTIEYS